MRWLVRDPLLFEGGINHYEYVESDPVNYVDPEGETRIKQDRLNAGPCGGGGYSKPASSFSGRSGYEIQIKGSNTPETICGLRYSGHSLDRMQGRGITPSVVQNTLRTGSMTTQPTGHLHYYDSTNNISVILDPSGTRVISVLRGK